MLGFGESLQFAGFIGGHLSQAKKYKKLFKKKKKF